jgi:hypothetical protein
MNAQIVKGREGRNYFRLMDVLEIMSHEAVDEGADSVWQRSYPA